MADIPFLVYASDHRPDIASGSAVHVVDVAELQRSKLLIAGGSGSGKSQAMRALLEQLAGHVQLHVFDFEGELVTLADVAAFLIVGDRGHVPAHPDHAARLAERVMATGVSAVLNLSELTVPDRQLFVARYLDAMMALPRDAWRPCLVAIDEVQLVCPERTDGDPVSAAAVVDVAARGRKRGIGLVVATQRMAKVRKDLVAECHNRLFGFITLPADVKAAGGELGLDNAGRRALTQLTRGHFFAQGPAISRATVQVQTAPVRTAPPVSGADYAAAAPADVQALLAQLGDFSTVPASSALPVDAVPYESTRGGMVSALQAELANMESRYAAMARTLEATSDARDRIQALFLAFVEKIETAAEDASLEFSGVALEEIAAGKVVDGVDVAAEPLAYRMEPWPSQEPQAGSAVDRAPRIVKRSPNDAPKKVGPRAPASHAVLAALEQLARLGETAPAKELVAGWVGVPPASSTWRGYLADLRRDGLIDDVRGGILLTLTGQEIGAAMAPPFASRRALHAHWFAKLGNATAEVLAVLIEAQPRGLSRAALGERIGVAPGSSTFRGYMAALRRPQLITVDGQTVRASDLLFPKGLRA